MATQKKKSTKVAAARSLKRSPSPPFFVFRMTHQTIYWLILSALVLALGTWVIILSMKVHTLYDQIDRETPTVIQSTPKQ